MDVGITVLVPVAHIEPDIQNKLPAHCLNKMIRVRPDLISDTAIQRSEALAYQEAVAKRRKDRQTLNATADKALASPDKESVKSARKPRSKARRGESPTPKPSKPRKSRAKAAKAD